MVYRLNQLWIGIDPGASGGVTSILTLGKTSIVKTVPLAKMSQQELWEWINEHREQYTWNGVKVARVFVVIEEQRPRPTVYFDRRTKKLVNTILKSTCLLYGNYCKIVGMLVAAGVPFEEVTPQKWQKEFSLVKAKGEKPTKWKNRLKTKAQSLFPRDKITLAVADSTLIAEYARRKHGGK